MVADLPPQLHDLTVTQRGVLARAQVLSAGLSEDAIAVRLRRGSWQRLYPGVYATFSGQVSRSAELWAAVLHAGPGAILSHQTAAELWGLAAEPSSLIHVTVPGNRRVHKQAGIRLHVSVRASAAAHPSRNPPQTRLEPTVIDLWETAQSLDDAVGWVTRAIGRRLTTQDKLRVAMEARGRVRWRKRLAELLRPDAAGIHSPLEHRYVRDVERPHRLPAPTRQAGARRSGRNEYRDTLYEAYQTVVELDGRVAHPGDSRWKDIHRDNAAATSGLTTLRYGWHDVTTRACTVAAEIAAVLADRGYTSARPCSPGCPVGREPQPVPENAGLRRGAAPTRPPGTGRPMGGSPRRGAEARPSVSGRSTRDAPPAAPPSAPSL